jgi:hypothetical protein
MYNSSILPLNEKFTATSGNPFKDLLFTPTSAPSPFSSTDPEAQDSLPYKPKPKRSKLGLCVLVICILLIWALFVFGAVLLMDMVFPGALRYGRITDLKIEMMDTEAAVSMLKNQVGGLYRYIEGLSVLGGSRGYGNGTMQAVMGEGLGLETLSGIVTGEGLGVETLSGMM